MYRWITYTCSTYALSACRADMSKFLPKNRNATCDADFWTFVATARNCLSPMADAITVSLTCSASPCFLDSSDFGIRHPASNLSSTLQCPKYEALDHKSKSFFGFADKCQVPHAASSIHCLFGAFQGRKGRRRPEAGGKDMFFFYFEF